MTDVMERVATHKQFIGGAWVEAASGKTLDVENPANEQVIAKVPASGAEDVDRAANAAATAFETWQHTTPQDRSILMLKLADAIEARAEEIGRLESLNTGKPVGVAIDEIPVVVDNLRFFAGAGRVLEGKAANEYMAGHTEHHPPRAGRRRRLDRPVELPDHDGRLEDRPRAHGRQHRRPQAVGAHAAHRDPARGDRRGHPPAGRPERHHRHGRRHRRRPRGPSQDRHGLGDRRHGHRQAHRQDRRGTREAAPPGARRQGAGGGVRRCGPRRGHRQPQDVLVLEHRPGLHGAVPRDHRPEGLRQLRRRPRRRP